MLTKILLALMAVVLMLIHADVIAQGTARSSAPATTTAPARSSAPAPGLSPAPARLDSGLVHFFVGDWKGEGKLANGQPIASSLHFSLSLDSTWLVSEHADVPPHTYKATSYWGVDASTKQFVAIVLDNFHGHRSFSSSGFTGGRLVLTTSNYMPGVGTYFEHFLIERLSDTQFRMSYETSRDAITWRLGDSLIFTRQA